MSSITFKHYSSQLANPILSSIHWSFYILMHNSLILPIPILAVSTYMFLHHLKTDFFYSRHCCLKLLLQIQTSNLNLFLMSCSIHKPNQRIFLFLVQCFKILNGIMECALSRGVKWVQIIVLSLSMCMTLSNSTFLKSQQWSNDINYLMGLWLNDISICNNLELFLVHNRNTNSLELSPPTILPAKHQ